MPNELDPRVLAGAKELLGIANEMDGGSDTWEALSNADRGRALQIASRILAAADAAAKKKSLDEILAQLPDRDAPTPDDYVEVPKYVMDAVVVAFARLGVAPDVPAMIDVGAAAMRAAGKGGGDDR